MAPWRLKPVGAHSLFHKQRFRLTVYWITENERKKQIALIIVGQEASGLRY